MEIKNENVLAEQYKAMEHEMNTDPVEIYKVMEQAAVGAYKKIEEDVVEGYKKVEDTFVGAYRKVEDTFVEKLFAREGETAEDAKKRLQGK